MKFVGAPFDVPLIRALARFAIFAFPAYALMAKLEPNSADRFAFKQNAKHGLFVGALVSLVWVFVHLNYDFDIPWTIHAWLNVILLSPIAEELLFRRAIIEYMQTNTKIIIAVFSSAILFALFHIPWWVISGEKTFREMGILLAIMIVYGLVFGGLYIRTRSIWSSLIPHAVNNLISISMIR